MREVFYIILVPLFMFLVILAFFGFWLVASVYIYSSGDVTKSEDTPYFAVNWNNQNRYSLILYLFGLFWNCEFAIAFCQFIISSAACMWYFSHMGAQLSSPICRSISRALCHHIGSLLLGSLILAIV